MTGEDGCENLELCADRVPLHGRGTGNECREPSGAQTRRTKSKVEEVQPCALQEAEINSRSPFMFACLLMLETLLRRANIIANGNIASLRITTERVTAEIDIEAFAR